MPVEIRREGGRGGNQRALARAARRLLDHLGLEGLHLSLLLCDDTMIRRLNRDYREKDAATDVLSFPMDGAEGPLLGDLAISTDTAARQAEEQGHRLVSELHVLLVHGLLHLLGYDHHGPEQTRQMRAAEAELLAVLDEDAASLIHRARVSHRP